MPTRLCLTAGCPHPATHRGRCHIHAKARPYHTKAWQLVRRRRLLIEPLCRECGEVAEHVDHRVPTSAGGSAYALENTMSLCATCHAAKSHAEQGRF